MNEKDKFDIARELIRHEDGLVNNRVTWLLVFQGLLFNAFVSGVGLFEKFSQNARALWSIMIGLIIICFFGIAVSLTAYNVLSIALLQMEEVGKWWEKTDLANRFPLLSGKLGSGRFNRWFSTGRMPCLLIVVWVLLFILLVISSILCLFCCKG